MAASGGVDSTTLAHGLAQLSDRHALRVSLGHVNHGLRGAESQADEAAVRSLGERLGVPVRVRAIEPELLRQGCSSRARPTLQEAARSLRYRALLELAAEADAECVATAHHADDQAETVLLRLLRGCGPDGLGGIPEISHAGRVVRPLLSVPRAAICAYASASELEWREDRSNADARYARNRLRHRWLPGLAGDFNPQLLRTIGNLAEAHRRDAEWIEAHVDREAARLFKPGADDLRIARGEWPELPEALARRLARRALVRLGGGRDVSRTHLERFVDFLRHAKVGSGIELPGGLRLDCERREFRLWRNRVEPEGAC